MLIDKKLLDSLTAQATESPRLRMHYDLRNSSNDQSQRMLNAMEMGTKLPIHRHTTTSETMIVIRGSLKEIFYDDKGNITEEFTLSATGPNYGLNIPINIWHSLEVLEPNTVIFEAKDGPYQPGETLEK